MSPSERKGRQPGFASDSPQLVGRRQPVGLVQRSEIHLDLVGAARKDGRAAAGAEEAPLIIAGFALDRHRVLRKYRRAVKKRAMMLAAVETVAEPDPVRPTRRHHPAPAPQATTRPTPHANGKGTG